MAVHLFLTLTGAASGFLVMKFFKDKISSSLSFSPAWGGLLIFLFFATLLPRFFLFLFWLIFE